MVKKKNDVNEGEVKLDKNLQPFYVIESFLLKAKQKPNFQAASGSSGVRLSAVSCSMTGLWNCMTWFWRPAMEQDSADNLTLLLPEAA
ncbi:hypothetical protein E2C01_099308 [Portunus trituberculatus]|uniref:Uncharacterized protein n=1 Tax=Portunus trituberculatus TaxID=210409 RepID=A0A5B7K561_PORTR|nr:hypothetical protein [Portunus trituberculatus]